MGAGPRRRRQPVPFRRGVGQRFGLDAGRLRSHQDAGSARPAVQFREVNNKGHKLYIGTGVGPVLRQAGYGILQQPDGGGAVKRHYQQAGVVHPFPRRNPPAVRGPGHSVRPRTGEECHAATPQFGYQRGDQRMHAAPQSGDGGSGFGTLRSGPPALGGDGGCQGAVGTDPGAESGRHHVNVEQCRIGRMHAAHDGFHEAFQDAPAHPLPDQVRHAGDGGAGPHAGRKELVQGSAEGAGKPQRPSDFGIPRVGRNSQDTGFGQFPGALGELDPGAARMGRNNGARDAELRREIRHGTRAGGKGLRSAVQRQASHHMAAYAAAPGLAGFKDGDLPAGFGKLQGREQARNPAAHHHGRGHGRFRRGSAHRITPGKWSE
ncbi:hypothetical protein D9M72_384850 [compost metagenome]